MNLSYDQAVVFHAVARHGSFSRAAKALYRSQSAVSIQVAKLEAEIGQPLFHRTTRHLALTEAGKVLLKYVGEIEGLMKEAVQELEDLDRLEAGRLVLCTSDTTGCYRLPALLKSFQDRYPGIDIVVKNATSLRTIQAVVDGEVDLGVVTLAYLPKEIESIPLFSRHDVLTTPPDHPLADRETVHLKDLEQYPLILLDRHCASRRLIDDLCEKSRVRLDVAMELSFDRGDQAFRSHRRRPVHRSLRRDTGRTGKRNARAGHDQGFSKPSPTKHGGDLPEGAVPFQGGPEFHGCPAGVF